jgi:hypothetical protein
LPSKLEVRLTERQFERLRAAANDAGMNVSDYVRWCCLREEPGRRRQHERKERERGLKERAQEMRRAPAEPEPQAPEPEPAEPLLSVQTVALQAGLTYFAAERLVAEGRVTSGNGRILIDGEPV